MGYTRSKPEPEPKNRPIARIAFARIIGKDKDGDVLGSAQPFGAIWERKNGKKGGILRFDHIPIELTQHQGVVFVSFADDDEEGNGGAR
jgi:hypothetical protein